MAFASDLSVIIPGRNEQFMRHTIEDVLANSRADTEVIAICDASWPNPPIVDHPQVKLLHTTHPVGQRAATNLGAQISRAKYVMKLDAHCAVDEGFDVKMLEKMQPDWTMIPSMHRLHVFDWHCGECGERMYQGVKPKKCENEECDGTDFTMVMMWQPRFSKGPTVSWRFDSELHFQYWHKHKKRPEVVEQAKTGIIETMSCIGCAFLMERERFWELGGMDEGHGSWGQYGTELACKAWLSGGKLVTCLNTWIAHLFRTGNFGKNGQSSWPYPINQRDIDAARKYSRELWLNDKWPKAVRPFSWLIEHFKPVPDWNDE
jgi:glycosyltransferase involved in cell wall biosynthesis